MELIPLSCYQIYRPPGLVDGAYEKKKNEENVEEIDGTHRPVRSVGRLASDEKEQGLDAVVVSYDEHLGGVACGKKSAWEGRKIDKPQMG